MTGRRKGCFWIWWDSEEKEEEAICSEGKGRGGLVVLRPKHSTSIYSTKYQSQECISFVYFCRHNPWNIVFLFNMLKLRIWKVMNISYSFNMSLKQGKKIHWWLNLRYHYAVFICFWPAKREVMISILTLNTFYDHLEFCHLYWISCG